MTLKHEKRNMIFAGLIIGVIASLLVLFGNPKNMGFCIACFLRDTAGGLGLHSAAAVQYIRPEIIGLVLGSFIMAISHKEFSARGGSAPGPAPASLKWMNAGASSSSAKTTSVRMTNTPPSGFARS